MAQEQESRAAPLRSIRYDLQQRILETQGADGTTVRFTFSPTEVLQEVIVGGMLEQAPTDDVVGSPLFPAGDRPQGGPKTKTPAEVLSGKLQTKPREGNPDRRGKPTATARFLAHREGHEGALPLFSTFHGATREIALRLNEGDQITAQGYYHPSRDPEGKRLGTFSIFHLMNHPGKRMVETGSS